MPPPPIASGSPPDSHSLVVRAQRLSLSLNESYTRVNFAFRRGLDCVVPAPLAVAVPPPLPVPMPPEEAAPARSAAAIPAMNITAAAIAKAIRRGLLVTSSKFNFALRSRRFRG